MAKSNYEDVAEHAKLDPGTRQRFIQYMRTRWADEEAQQSIDGYALEWAKRFKAGREYAASDSEGQAILRQMRRQEEAQHA